MQTILSSARRWAAPGAAAVFFVLWCAEHAGRFGPAASLLPKYWTGAVPLAFITAAIGVAALWPLVSLSLTALLLAGQLLRLVPPMESGHWAIYVGAFLSLALIAWTGSRRMRIIAFAASTVFAAGMAFLLLSHRYGAGVGWFPSVNGGDRATLTAFGPQLFSLLLLMAAG